MLSKGITTPHFSLGLLYLILSDDPVGLRWFYPLQDDLFLIGAALNGLQRNGSWYCGETHLSLKTGGTEDIFKAYLFDTFLFASNLVLF